MHRYFVHTPRWVPWIFPQYTWRMPAAEPAVYLTFDDGPHPEITPWVLQQLHEAGGSGTFFCVGANVDRYAQVYDSILQGGHTVGNHTQTHPNGWRTGDDQYLRDVAEAADRIRSRLFRPPYGRLRASQYRGLAAAMRTEPQVVMWDVLSADFDPQVSREECLKNVVSGVKPGSILVFHDSDKAWRNLEWVLPKAIENLSEKGFAFRAIPGFG